MESHNLYRVKEEDLDKLIRILTVCFSEDPLYHALIPDRDTRERLMPELFTCDLTEFFETCEIYADSSELNSILVVSDGTEHEAALHNLMVDFFALLKTDGYLIKEDPSLATLRKFIQGCLSDKMSYSFDDSWIIIHFEHHSIFYVILFHQFFFAFFCIHIHASEFVHFKWFSILTDPYL